MQEAEVAFQSALRLDEQLERLGSDAIAIRDRRGILHFNMGNLMQLMERDDESGEHYRAALVVQEKLLHERPTDVEMLDAFAATHLNFGNLLQYQGRFEEAEEMFQKVLELDERLLDSEADRPVTLLQQGRTYYNLGNLNGLMGRYDRVPENFHQSTVVLQSLMTRLATIPWNEKYGSNWLPCTTTRRCIGQTVLTQNSATRPRGWNRSNWRFNCPRTSAAFGTRRDFVYFDWVSTGSVWLHSSDPCNLPTVAMPTTGFLWPWLATRWVSTNSLLNEWPKPSSGRSNTHLMTIH